METYDIAYVQLLPSRITIIRSCLVWNVSIAA